MSDLGTILNPELVFFHKYILLPTGVVRYAKLPNHVGIGNVQPGRSAENAVPFVDLTTVSALFELEGR